MEERQVEFEYFEVAKKLACISDETILLLPIAKEICPKVADNLMYYKNMHYALQGTIIVEIRLLKEKAECLQAALSKLQNECLQQGFKTHEQIQMEC